MPPSRRDATAYGSPCWLLRPLPQSSTKQAFIEARFDSAKFPPGKTPYFFLLFEEAGRGAPQNFSLKFVELQFSQPARLTTSRSDDIAARRAIQFFSQCVSPSQQPHTCLSERDPSSRGNASLTCFSRSK